MSLDHSYVAATEPSLFVRVLLKVTAFLARLNGLHIALGRHIAWVCVALMVAAILLQVFCRYVLNSALPWPEEVARALMIWMMALVAGNAYRQGAFVSINMIHEYLPKKATEILQLVLLLFAGVVLVKLFTLGIDFFERGFRTRAASFHLSRAWIYLAMPVCFGTMLLVNVELLCIHLGRLFGREEDFPLPGP